MQVRGDLSDQLIHLTRGTAGEAQANFESIFRSGTLQGSTRDIKGGYTCVCFSEAPLSVIAEMIARDDARYQPFGIMVAKTWLFTRGGRPVIYQADAEFDLLNEALRYRHVRYEPPEVDWTWEREWRLRTGTLSLDPEAVTLIVPTREWAVGFRQRASALQRATASGIINTHTHFRWHIIALGDLGVRIDWPPEPLSR